jgi:hypothetical protein
MNNTDIIESFYFTIEKNNIDLVSVRNSNGNQFIPFEVWHELNHSILSTLGVDSIELSKEIYSEEIRMYFDAIEE